MYSHVPVDRSGVVPLRFGADAAFPFVVCGCGSVLAIFRSSAFAICISLFKMFADEDLYDEFGNFIGERPSQPPPHLQGGEPSASSRGLGDDDTSKRQFS